MLFGTLFSWIRMSLNEIGLDNGKKDNDKSKKQECFIECSHIEFK